MAPGKRPSAQAWEADVGMYGLAVLVPQMQNRVWKVLGPSWACSLVRLGILVVRGGLSRGFLKLKAVLYLF